MRDSGAKAVTSMLDVQLKIIWKFERKRTIFMVQIGKNLSDRFLDSPNYIIII